MKELLQLNPGHSTISTDGSIPPLNIESLENQPHESFSTTLKNFLEDTYQQQKDAADLSSSYLKDQHSVPLHELLIAQESANINLQFFLNLKNHALEAYKEILNLSN
jgi:flagellar hook-basal body complex protein FliE